MTINKEALLMARQSLSKAIAWMLKLELVGFLGMTAFYCGLARRVHADIDLATFSFVVPYWIVCTFYNVFIYASCLGPEYDYAVDKLKDEQAKKDAEQIKRGLQNKLIKYETN
jgi:hypothetical protein